MADENEEKKERKTIHIRARNKAEAWQSDGAESTWGGKQYAARKSGKAGGEVHDFSQKKKSQ